jgi:hypothetical protein
MPASRSTDAIKAGCSGGYRDQLLAAVTSERASIDTLRESSGDSGVISVIRLGFEKSSSF